MSMVGYVCIEESFDTIFTMAYGSRKSAMAERVKSQWNIFVYVQLRMLIKRFCDAE